MWRRRIGIGLGVMLGLVFVLLVAGWLWLRSTGEPRRGGEVRLAGLSAPVTVRWDRWGVPHVTAERGEDLAIALGYLHAGDRFTQMELGRRVAAGRLGELVGPRALRLDHHSRALRLRRTAEELWRAAGGETRRWLEGYAAGVNAWLAERGGSLPPELEILGAAPEPWEPADSLGFALLMAEDLSFWQGRPELPRFDWLAALGPERLADLLGPPELQVPPAIAELAARRPRAPAADPAPPPPDAPPGSNNWALGSSRTTTGAPLVANDPHLALRLPGTWYQVLLRSPDYEVAGMTLPGLPGVVIGHNGHLAWAVTNTMLDDHDVFFERLSEDGTRARRGDGWTPVEVRREEVRLEGAEPVLIELRSTDIGPLFEPVAPGQPPYSLAWTAHHPGDPLAAFLGLGRARSFEEALAGFEGYVAPAQNLVLARRDGSLLFTVIGRQPRRRAGDGRLPSPAWDPAYGWDGLEPRGINPTVRDPAEDLLVTANHDIRPPGYDRPYTADFDTPHRAERIRRLLTARERWSAAELATVQADVVSLYAREVVAALDTAGPYSGEAERARRTLATWDGTMARRGPAALFALLEDHLRREIFGDEARRHGLRVALDSRGRLARLLRGEMAEDWFDDGTTPAVEGRREIFERALAAAWREGAARWGEEAGEWSYGRFHALTLEHPLGSVPVLGRWFQRGPIPMPGSATTPAAFLGAWREAEPRSKPTVHGPSMRWIADLADPDHSLAVLPGGQSGHPGDHHYSDQLPAYLAGELHPAPWTEAAIEDATVSRLRLLP